MERFYCADCYSVAQLDTHGRCISCGSQAVVSEELLKKRDQIVEWGNPPKRDIKDLFPETSGDTTSPNQATKRAPLSAVHKWGGINDQPSRRNA